MAGTRGWLRTNAVRRGRAAAGLPNLRRAWHARNSAGGRPGARFRMASACASAASGRLS